MIIFFLLFLTKDIWLEIIKIIRKILLPIVISFIISYFLNPLVKLINKKINNNNISIIVTLIIVITILFICVYISIPLLINEIINITNEVIPFINKLFSNTYLINYLFIKDIIISNIDVFITNITGNSIDIVLKSITLISNIILIIILSIYFLFNLEKIKQKIKEILNKKKEIILRLKNIDIALTSYLKSLYIIMFIEMIEYTFIYFLIGHPNYLLIGFLAGITSIIPYFGGLFTNAIALITAISYSKELFIISSIIILICPIIDSYIIDPKIYSKNININPLKTILLIIITTSIFGFIGVLFAIPIYLIINEILKSNKIKRNSKNC